MTELFVKIGTPDFLNDGLVIAIVGYVIVFSALVVLYFVFANFSKVINYNIRKKLRKEGKGDQVKEKELQISGDEAAAISMAIYLYHELHDEESNVITIKKVSKRYSPWSSKIYGLRNYKS
ncbi:MAG: OadG family protein [Bacteroidales bacterium]|nr:OadG family protein [Bacteroidales bacterium]MCF8387602.1 OadG family protein [Bacteroidales bacterium]MCF8397592.1 OadG family protein [Bacteroidales bacterium]